MEIKDLQHGVNVHREDGIAVLTMHNPEKRNAFSPAIRDGLIAHVEALMRDASCRALVLQGSGGTFCSGGDITTFEDRPAMAARRAMAQSHRYVRALITGGKPVIAAVEGYAFGGGLGLALCCDQVVAARDAKFCASFARVGLMPDIGLLWTLPQRVGLGAAKEMLMLATVLGAEEALELGLIDEVAEPGGALDGALALARRFAAMAPGALALTKDALARFPMDIEEELTCEAQGQGLLFGTEDVREGVRAFFEKRDPRFVGK